MKKVASPFSAKLPSKFAYGLSIASVAIAATFGVPAVRADSDTSVITMHEMVVAPVMNVFHAVEARLAVLETSVAQFAGSFASRQITAQELCVADQAGAQTCITKAQLDALLGAMARTAASAPATEGESVTELAVPAIMTVAAAEPQAAVEVVEQAAAEQVAEPLAIEPAVVMITESAATVMEAEVFTELKAPENSASEMPAAEVKAVEIVAAEATASETALVEDTSPAAAPVVPAIATEVAVEVIEAVTVVSPDSVTKVEEPETTGIATQEITASETAPIETAPIETTGIGTAPAEAPVEAAAEERRNEEPTTTGSITSSDVGLAVVSHPDVEISKAADGCLEE